MGRPLLLALGIAAIDMLCCAFIATILLFLALTKPPTPALAASKSSQGVSIVVITFGFSPSDAVVTMVITDPRGVASKPFAPAKRVVNWPFPYSNDFVKRVSWISGSDPTDSDGALRLEAPSTGKWTINVSYVGMPDDMRSSAPNAVGLKIFSIGCNPSPPPYVSLPRPADGGTVAVEQVDCMIE
jgi:hypothetical protein